MNGTRALRQMVPAPVQSRVDPAPNKRHTQSDDPCVDEPVPCTILVLDYNSCGNSHILARKGNRMRDWSDADWVDPKYQWKPTPVSEMPERLLIDFATR